MKRSVTITRELVSEVLRTGHSVPACRIASGIPARSSLIGAGLDRHGDLVLTFESDEFASEAPLNVVIAQEAPAT